VQTRQPPEWGEQPEPHGEVVTVRDGRVVEMVVYSTVDEALSAGASRPADGKGGRDEGRAAPGTAGVG
ncbi:MAG: hypothetical protein ACR2G3_11335, partial [Solirubrobacterales bacterium]